MRGRLGIALVLSALTAAGCWQLKHCQIDKDCGDSRLFCQQSTNVCALHSNGDAGSEAPVTCSSTSCAGTTPICPAHPDGGFAACAACTSDMQCSAISESTPACAPTGACVPCVADKYCAGKTPICNTATNTCGPCVKDSDCTNAPGVCMGDGHCADSSEVIFVQYSAAGCPNADGTATNPFCTLQSGAAALSSTRPALVVVGPANDQLTLATSGFSPLIVGRADSSPTPGSIPANAGTAITVSSDNVMIRNLVVNVGTGMSTKGIVVKGNGTKLSLADVTVSLTTGLGIDAEAGATLTMNHCTISNNKGGGIFLNGAAYDIEDTTVTNNGAATLNAISWGGVLVNALPASGPSTLKSLTVTNNLAPGIVCLPTSVTADGVLVYNNTPTDVVNCPSISTCGDAGTTTCGAQP